MNTPGLNAALDFDHFPAWVAQMAYTPSDNDIVGATLGSVGVGLLRLMRSSRPPARIFKWLGRRGRFGMSHTTQPPRLLNTIDHLSHAGTRRE